MTQRNNASNDMTSKNRKKNELNNLLLGMEKSVVDSFTSEQLEALEKVVHVREWRKHDIDVRPTIVIPFIPRSYYLVFLLGTNKRNLSTPERAMALTMFLLVVFIISILLFGLVFVVLYLLKSALGIDIFSNSSLGLWDEFKRLFDD